MSSTKAISLEALPFAPIAQQPSQGLYDCTFFSVNTADIANSVPLSPVGRTIVYLLNYVSAMG